MCRVPVEIIDWLKNKMDEHLSNEWNETVGYLFTLGSENFGIKGDGKLGYEIPPILL